MDRRTYLRATAATGTALAAGCLGRADGGSQRDCWGEQRSVDVPPTGDPGADVTVAAYTDFACPACRTYVRSVFPEIKSDYVEPGEIAYRHRDFPVPVDKTWSWVVPNAAFAVYENADAEAYYAYIEEVFRHQGEYSSDTVVRLASEFGPQERAIHRAIEREPFCAQINESRSAALDRGVEATPTIYVDDQPLEAPSADDLREAIESAL